VAPLTAIAAALVQIATNPEAMRLIRGYKEKCKKLLRVKECKELLGKCKELLGRFPKDLLYPLAGSLCTVIALLTMLGFP